MIILSFPLAARRGPFHQLYAEYKWWSSWRRYNEDASV